MNIGEAREFMKEYFEKLYKKLENEKPILLKLPDLPEEMTVEGTTDGDGWAVWKLIPSTVTDEDIANEEEGFGVKFPVLLKAYLSTYHHGFDVLGFNYPGEPFEALDNAFNPHLADNDYLPFAWDEDRYFIRCIDLRANSDGDQCPVVQFDHEELLDMLYEYEDNNEAVPREVLEKLAEQIAPSLKDYLNNILDDDNEYIKIPEFDKFGDL